MPMRRHFTATGLLVHEHRVALHWHPKLQAWLPPGGHIKDDEDPVQAVLREIQEETGLDAEVVSAQPLFKLDYPAQVPPPIVILVEDIHDSNEGYHQHIDMIYACRPVGPPGPLNDGWTWASEDQLAGIAPLKHGGVFSASPPEDVRVLARHAFRIVEKSTA